MGHTFVFWLWRKRIRSRSFFGLKRQLIWFGLLFGLVTWREWKFRLMIFSISPFLLLYVSITRYLLHCGKTSRVLTASNNIFLLFNYQDEKLWFDLNGRLRLWQIFVLTWNLDFLQCLLINLVSIWQHLGLLDFLFLLIFSEGVGIWLRDELSFFLTIRIIDGLARWLHNLHAVFSLVFFRHYVSDRTFRLEFIIFASLRSWLWCVYSWSLGNWILGHFLLGLWVTEIFFIVSSWHLFWLAAVGHLLRIESEVWGL